jgi:hypothetical protein
MIFGTNFNRILFSSRAIGNCIRLSAWGVNNALLTVMFSNTPFEVDGQSVQRIVTTRSDTEGGGRLR